MTQQQLAVHLNLSASQLSNIERGVKEPRPELLEKMAATLNIPREEFFLVSEKAKTLFALKVIRLKLSNLPLAG